MGVLITHGGMSSITASLAAGVPMVCIPQGREQPINAARLAATGAGRVLAPDAPAAEIRAAVDAALRDGQARAAARRFAAATPALGAGESATDAVEKLVRPLGARGISRKPAVR